MRKSNHFRRIQKKRYKSRQYENPYFKKTKNIPIIPISITIGIFVLAGLVTSFFFGYSYFSIKTVHVDGIDHIGEEDFQSKTTGYLQSSKYLFFSNKNKFLFDSEKLQNHLEQYFTFETFQASVKKQHLSIAIEERSSKLLWKTGSKLFLVDLSGVVIREMTRDEFEGEGSGFSHIPVFVDRNNVKAKVGTHVLNEQEILNTFRFQKHLLAQGIGSGETQVDRLAGKWTSVITDKGYDILFDFSADVDKQALRLEALLRDTVKDASKLKYIDLRFGDHVYYR